MNEIDEEILSDEGWTVECYSPLEIRHNDGSFASGQAAKMVIGEILQQAEIEEIKSRRYYPL